MPEDEKEFVKRKRMNNSRTMPPYAVNHEGMLFDGTVRQGRQGARESAKNACGFEHLRG